MSTTYNPSESFREAASYLSKASSLSSVSNATKLELYAIFKYLTVSSTPNVPKPSIFDFTGKAKWEAWQTAGKTYQDPSDAEKRYLEIARSLGWVEGKAEEPKPATTKESEDGGEEDIWDKSDDEGESMKPKREGGAMGRTTSTMTMEDDKGSSSALSNLAVAGDVSVMLAYFHGQPDADVNARDENGYTPLHLAADRGHLEVVDILLKRGANPEIKDPDEFTAKELAEIAGHTDIAALLSDTQNASP
ncbi:ankyrin [Lentinus tigrinus ALCF2SS1-7]|uniref:ankyrin n=1 Tax=Lentinus tigrinus ALCF2SS1-7 TaxID=1328758 RepID=UPI001165DF92|nr:ankyrin [Lentinus tigrinus ALCF2SS1-7]